MIVIRSLRFFQYESSRKRDAADGGYRRNGRVGRLRVLGLPGLLGLRVHGGLGRLVGGLGLLRADEGISVVGRVVDVKNGAVRGLYDYVDYVLALGKVAGLEMEIEAAYDGRIDLEVIGYVGSVVGDAVNGSLVVDTVPEVDDRVALDDDPASEIVVITRGRTGVVVALLYGSRGVRTDSEKRCR